jgi:hypothetical protein
VQVSIARGVSSDKVSRGVRLRDLSDAHLQKQKEEGIEEERSHQYHKRLALSICLLLHSSRRLPFLPPSLPSLPSYLYHIPRLLERGRHGGDENSTILEAASVAAAAAQVFDVPPCDAMRAVPHKFQALVSL